MNAAARSTVLVFCDPEHGVCGLARTEPVPGGPARNTIVAVDGDGVTNWMVWPGAPAFGDARPWTFSDQAWRLDDPTHLGVAGQLGLFAFDERRVSVTLETSESFRLAGRWERGPGRVASDFPPARSAPDRRLRRLFSAPSRAFRDWRASLGGGRSLVGARVAGALNIEGRETALDGFGWVETTSSLSTDTLTDESWTISLQGPDGSHLLAESFTRGSGQRTRGTLRGKGGAETVTTWRLEGETPLAGQSAAMSLHAEAGGSRFDWTGEASSVVSEPVQARGRYATRQLVRFSKDGRYEGIGAFYSREYP